MDLIAHIDGGARGNPGPAAIGVVVHDEAGNLLFSEGKFIGHGTNNEAEYTALIYLLEKAATERRIVLSEAGTLRIFSDSLLVVMQVRGEWKIKEPRLQDLFKQVQAVKLTVPFALTIRHIPREENKDADRLVNEALDRAQTAVAGS
jgi:ribonuclease HI